MNKLKGARMKPIVNFALIVCAVISCDLFAAGIYDGGDGSGADPFQIRTAGQFDELGQHSEDWAEGIHFLLTDDIDLSGYDGLDGRPVFHRIGEDEDNPFFGVFDGAGHTVSNLTLDSPTAHYVGLFGWVEGDSAEIKNLGVVNSSISGEVHVGGVVGVNFGGTVSNCYAVAAVTGNSGLGGLVGFNSGTVRNCYARGEVSGWRSVGGLVGWNPGTIINCYSASSVSGDENVGGFVGDNSSYNGSDATYTNCFWDDTINKGLADTGSDGDVAGVDDRSTVEMKISSAYTEWDFVGTWWIDEGLGYPRLAWQFVSVDLVEILVHKGQDISEGVFVVYCGGDGTGTWTITEECDWLEVSPASGITGEATDVTVTVSPASLAEGVHEGEITVLVNEPDNRSAHVKVRLSVRYAGGDGSGADPFEIRTAGQFYELGQHSEDWGLCFVLANDIDLSGYDGLEERPAFQRIGTGPDSPFAGVFDGAGYRVSYLTLELPDTDYVGLFGWVEGVGAEIKNLGVVESRISGYVHVGGVVGVNFGGTVSNCYSTAVVRGTVGLGGLVGFNMGTLSNCYATGEVFGGRTVGGLVGCNPGTIINCYSANIVYGSEDVGGFVGSNLWEGTSGTYVGCFWDSTVNAWLADTGSDGDVEGVDGTDPFYMVRASTYTAAGWDFESVWRISEGVSYPRFLWDFPYAGGSGTSSDPYRIATGAHLDGLGRHSEDWGVGKHFVLVDDIDLSGYDGLDGRPVFHMIGYYSYEKSDNHPFVGEFDGAGHTISNLRLNLPGTLYVGLFGCIAAIEGMFPYEEEESGRAKIINVGVVDLEVTGLEVIGENEVNYGGVGGLVGRNNGGIIFKCYTTGNVSGVRNVGGLVGYSGRRYQEVNGIISNSYSTCNVSGEGYVGGLVGYSYYRIGAINCYAAGVISGEGYVGGIVGYSRDGIYSGCFWDSTVNPGLDDYLDGAYGLSTDELMMGATYADAGWDLSDVWSIDEGVGYPQLVGNELYAGGGGTIDDPYRIATAEQLNVLGQMPWDWADGMYFVLVEDIDLSGFDGQDGRPVFHRIGTGAVSPFAGVFNGAGHTVSNLTLNLPGNDYVGLFGWVEGDNAEIKNLGVVESSISGVTHVGGVVGVNFYGTVSNCYAEAAVMGNGSVGGLVGFNRGTLSNCYAISEVSGGSSVGGLVGWNPGTVINCYSASGVSGDDNVGGFVGDNLWEGTSGEYSGCFWDYTASGRPTGTGSDGDVAGIEGKYTADMMKASTYAGWDFAGTWSIDESISYPHLLWDGYAGGGGTIEYPYRIATAVQLAHLSQMPWDWADGMYFVLVEDIDLSGYDGLDGRPEFYRIGIDGDNPFAGVFDGAGHTISNLRLNLPDNDYVGLFGWIEGDSAEIKNLGVVESSILGVTHVGGVVGVNFGGTVSNCFAMDAVTGNASVGGLVGFNSGAVSNCYAISEVFGDHGVGGLVGWNPGTVINCYSASGVSGDNNVGGFVGDNLWDGTSGEYSGCFWDYTVNDGLDGTGSDGDVAGIEGASTVEMQTVGSYTAVGWDFIGVADGGDDDIWRLCVDGSGYPRLWGEFGSYGDFVCPGGVGIEDFAYLSESWLRVGTVERERGDLDGDGVVGIGDLVVFSERWLSFRE